MWTTTFVPHLDTTVVVLSSRQSTGVGLKWSAMAWVWDIVVSTYLQKWDSVVHT